MIKKKEKFNEKEKQEYPKDSNTPGLSYSEMI